MAEVVTIVRGVIPAGREHEVVDPYRAGTREGPPPEIEETFLLRSDGGRMAILSVWHRRSGLDAMLASGEEPFARRLIREAGGTPDVQIYDIVHRTTTRSGT
jgi:hypothetical protein